MRSTFAALLAVVVGMLGLSVATAQAEVSNPGTANADVTSGNLELGTLDPIGIGSFGAGTIAADVAAGGEVTVAQSDFVFPDQAPLAVQVGGNDVATLLSLVATGDGSGSVDPDSGTFDLEIPVAIGIEGVNTDLGASCGVGPVTLNLSGTDYNQEDGTVTLEDAGIEFPAASGCDKIGGVIDFEAAFNAQAGLPAGGTLTLVLDTADTAPLGPLHAGFTAGPLAGTGPLTVSFDASESRSRIVSYTWDFGDGSAPQVETEPTTEYTYDVIGSYIPSLTVARADSSTETFTLEEAIVVTGATATITAQPEELSNVSNPTFEFESDLTPASFECSLDGAAFTECESPKQYADLADGAHEFAVRAIHQGVTGLAVSYEFEIDTVKPVVTIDEAPDAINGPGSNTAVIDFSANETGLDFECSYGGEPFAPCVAPYEVEWDEVDAEHNFRVKAIDDLGNESAPAVANWRMDVTPPATTITSSPASPNGHYDDARAGFEFEADEPATFVCEFNDGEERPCATGIQAGTGDQGAQERLGQPQEGNNSFQVWAIDEAGNRDPAGATASYEFIGEQPEISVLNGPNEFTTYRDANIVFQSGNQDVTRFECRDLAQGTAWTDCEPGSINDRTGRWVASDLAEGEHTLEVRGVNAIGTESKADNIGTYTWTIDRTPPTVEILSGPVEGGYTTETSAVFELGGSEEGLTFECNLDNDGWNPCSTPLELSGLSAGSHTLTIRGTDRAEHASTNTDSWSWNVGSSDVNITSAPASLSPVATAAFQFESTPAAAQYECRLDPTANQNLNDTGWSNCASPASYSSLSDGEHRFEVRGDGGFPAIYTWTVSTAGPVVVVTGAPEGYSGLAQNSATIEFTAEDPNGEVTEFECRYMEVGALPQPWDPCTSPQNVSWDENSDGTSMRFEVRATSPAGNIGPVTQKDWEIISTLPTVALGTAVAGWDGTDQTGGVATGDSDVPAPLTKVAAPQFRFTSSSAHAGANFACQLNEGDVTYPCGANGSPGLVIISEDGPDALGVNPVEGENSLKVWAVDAGGNTSEDYASYTWTQDTTAPTITFTSENPSVTNSEELHVTFSSDEDVRAVGGLKCRLDGAPATDDPETWDDCDTMVDPASGEWVGAGLIKGQHTLDVKGIDVLDNRQETGNGARYKFTIDRTVPSSQITSAPSGTVVEDTATIAFTGSAASGIARFECDVDGAGWSTCASPLELSGLADGPHTVQVRAVDKAGNVEDVPAEVSWAVDSTKPQITLSDDLNLVGGATNQTSVEFNYTVTPADSDVSCRLIGPGQTEATVAWSPCSSPASFSDLADGGYEFQVKAVNDLGTESDVSSRSWSIDTVAPVTTIESAPSGTINTDEASITFSADDPAATFTCQLNDGSADACTSPVTFSGLADDEHSVTVIATDALGNEGAPAVATWSVDTTAPIVSIDQVAIAEPTSTEASVQFSSDDPGASFECKLDSGAFESCVSPKDYTGLAVGPHTVTIRATDAAGNVSAEVSESWTVTAPEEPVCPDGTVGTPPNCVVPQPEPEANLARVVVKGPKAVRSGKRFQVRVRIANRGEAAANRVRVCVRTQRARIAGKAQRCRVVRTVPAGKVTVVKFKLRAKKIRKRGPNRVRTRVVAIAPTGAALAGGPTARNRTAVIIRK